jgi:F-type H+-transporting ATPase subunit b
MAEHATTNATTEVPADHHGKGGFPPFKVETFPSQLFWLAITFTFLFVVLWRFVGPRIQGAIADRRERIANDVAEAERHRREAEQASAAYDSALNAARGRALGTADEMRKRIAAEVADARAKVDAEAAEAMAKAEARIASSRVQARANVAAAAQEATVEIVLRLIGEQVAPADAAAAVKATGV